MYIWTIYDHPADCPNAFIARAFLIEPGKSTPTGDTFAAPDLATMRKFMEHQGLTCLARSPEDDEVIVESWI